MKLTEVHPGYKAMTDEQLANHIRERLGMNPQWARRALLALYDEQTEAEQQDPENVHESNGRGFSENDQKFLSSLAEQARRGESFSQKQLGWLYTLLPKYAKQMVKLVREMEKMEQAVILKLYFNQITIDNSMKMMKGLSGPLGLDPMAMPDEILITNPREDIFFPFKLAEVYAPEGRVTCYLYKGTVDGVDWIFYVEVAEEEELPQWAKDMGNAMGIQ